MSVQLTCIERVERVIAERIGDLSHCAVICMVSGGSDSTALAYVMHDLRAQGLVNDTVMLHVNHKLRGQDSDDDARFVRELAASLDILLFECEVDIARMVSETHGNMEAIARQERYRAAGEALESVCSHLGYSPDDVVICTAHSANDRVENFYMRSIVGTGPGGFRSMYYETYIQGCRVIRPLLEESRDYLRSFIMDRPDVFKGEHDEYWREDATNDDTDRFRAFVRHEIVPRAQERNPQLLETLTRTMNLIADEDDMITSYARSVLIEKVTPLGRMPQEGMRVSPELCKEPLPIQRRVIERMLKLMVPADTRIESASIQACLSALGCSGKVINIQNNFAVSYNKLGLRVEPMEAFRARRNKI